MTPSTTHAVINQDVMLELAGSGICQNVSVALGDNLNIISVGAVNFNPGNNYKWPVKVKYSKSGNYTLYVKDNGPSACGILTPKVAVGEPLQFAPIAVVLPAPVKPVALPVPKPAPVAAPVSVPVAVAKPPCVRKGKPELNTACAD